MESNSGPPDRAPAVDVSHSTGDRAGGNTDRSEDGVRARAFAPPRGDLVVGGGDVGVRRVDRPRAVTADGSAHGATVAELDVDRVTNSAVREGAREVCPGARHGGHTHVDEWLPVRIHLGDLLELGKCGVQSGEHSNVSRDRTGVCSRVRRGRGDADRSRSDDSRATAVSTTNADCGFDSSHAVVASGDGRTRWGPVADIDKLVDIRDQPARPPRRRSRLAQRGACNGGPGITEHQRGRRQWGTAR